MLQIGLERDTEPLIKGFKFKSSTKRGLVFVFILVQLLQENTIKRGTLFIAIPCVQKNVEHYVMNMIILLILLFDCQLRVLKCNMSEFNDKVASF